jgi:hypothetical protein
LQENTSNVILRWGKYAGHDVTPGIHCSNPCGYGWFFAHLVPCLIGFLQAPDSDDFHETNFARFARRESD